MQVRRENFLYFWREVEDFKSIPIAQTNYIQGRAEKVMTRHRRGASRSPSHVASSDRGQS